MILAVNPCAGGAVSAIVGEKTGSFEQRTVTMEALLARFVASFGEEKA